MKNAEYLRLFAVAAVLVMTLSCGGTYAYLGTDVCVVPGFDRSTDPVVRMSGGKLEVGTFAYRGYGRIDEVLHEYTVLMQEQGWSAGEAVVEQGTANVQLLKDQRRCLVEFRYNADDPELIEASVRVESLLPKPAGKDE